MIHESNQFKILFRKVLRGTASAEEQDSVRRYLEKEKPDLHSLLPFDDWVTTEEEAITVKEQAVRFAGIAQAAGIGQAKRNLSFKRWIPYAAALALFVTVFGVFKKGGDNRQEIVWRRVTTAMGRQSQVWLPDSSQVTLNAGSELRYPQHFEQGKREVYLSGEAFFQIRRNEASPFSVHTPLLDVSVLGTSFNVQAYSEDDHTAVSVKTGKVKVASVQHTDRHNILVPGQQAVYNKERMNFLVLDLDTAAVAQWRSRRISLEDMELGHILKVIGRTYDVQFHTGNPDLLRRKYSVTFYDMKLEEVLDKLAYLGALEFSKQGNQIDFKEQP